MSALAGLLTVSPTTFVPEDIVVWMGGQATAWVKPGWSVLLRGEGLMGCALSKAGWADWLYCEDSWQTEHWLSIRSVSWLKRWPGLVGAQPGACGEGLSSHSAPAGPHLDTELLSTRNTWKKWRRKSVRLCSTRFVQPGEEAASRGHCSSLPAPTKRSPRRWPSSSEWCWGDERHWA